MNDGPTLLHNFTPTPNNSLLVQLAGTQLNHSAIGARVVLRVKDHRMVDEVRSGGSFCSQSDLRLHFGLGANLEAELVEVQWPSGRKEVVTRVPANHWVVIKEGVGLVRLQKLLGPPKL